MARYQRVLKILNQDRALQPLLRADPVADPIGAGHSFVARVIKSLASQGYDALRVEDHLIQIAAIRLFPAGPEANAKGHLRSSRVSISVEPAVASCRRTRKVQKQSPPQTKAAAGKSPYHHEVVQSTSSTNSTNSTGQPTLEEAIVPPESLLSEYLDYARQQVESADSFLVGSVLPVVAACLARGIYFPWGQERIYPNLFSMLGGKSGDRKSSAINLAEQLARRIIPEKQFLPHACSSESLFNEFDQNGIGCPDKLLIAAEANPILGTWTTSGYGERVGQVFLNLYDCKPLSESFEKNRSNHQHSGGKRVVDETSTSVLLGATFDLCRLRGRGISSGLQRRFLFYVARQHGRFISLAPHPQEAHFDQLANKLKNIALLRGPCAFSGEASALWDSYQRRNRHLLESENDEARAARLNGAPRQVQKVAMIFSACVWANQDRQSWDGTISASVLEFAIAHVDHCLCTADWLDASAHKTLTQNAADTLLTRIRCDFASPEFRHDGWITLSKSQLTGRYASQPGRPNSWKPNDLYANLIPDLINRGLACQASKHGKKQSFSFLAQDPR